MWRWRLVWTLVRTVSPHKRRDGPQCSALGPPVQSAGPWSRVLPSTWWTEEEKTEIQEAFFHFEPNLLYIYIYIRWLIHQRTTTIQLSTSPSQEIRPEDLWGKQCRNTEIERFWFGGKWCQRWSQKSSPLSYHLWPLLAFPANTLFVVATTISTCHSVCFVAHWMDIPIHLPER